MRLNCSSGKRPAFSNASSLVLAEYRGLSVNQQMRLRRELDNVGASFSVMKMSLAKRAAENIGFENIVDFLSGPTGVAVINSDPVDAAKVLKNFSEEHEYFVIKGGRMEGGKEGLQLFEPPHI